MPPSLLTFPLYVCFFLSGAAGLLYEIFWAQRFSLLLGLDVYSQAAVLTAFMGGLALGSHLAGRWADALRRPWSAYAGLELGIGACGAAIPLIFPWLDGPLRAAYESGNQRPLVMTLLRFAVATAVLLPPTALMGATLPVMVVALRRTRDRLGEVVGRLYALNTAGAVIGVLLGGFVLGEWIGLSGTNYTAVALNVFAALVAWLAGRGVETGPTRPALSQASNATSLLRPDDARPVFARWPGWIALAAAITGAAAMMTQIGWTKALSLSIGGSTYAFSLIVAVFLVGLTIGARLAEIWVRRWRDAAVPWAMLCLISAVLCICVLAPLGWFPVLTERLLNNLVRERYWPVPVVQAILGLVTLLVLAAPTIVLGTTLPLACEAYAQRRATGAARVTGSVYAINTIGAMLGSALGGLVFVALFGIQGTLKLAALGYAIAAALAAAQARPARPPVFALGMLGIAAAGLAAVFVLGQPWDRLRMISAPYLLRRPMGEATLVFYREAPEGTIAVAYTPEDDNHALFINGKADASTRGDMPTQVLLGQLPMLLHGSAREAAVIGLGGGVTLHSVLTHDSIRGVEMIELSQAVADSIMPQDGSPGPFDEVNHRALHDPRVQLVVADGRNHLTLTSRTYDVIVSEPSNPWIAGVSSLFTREFFQSCRQRLNDDGILCQWLHSYTLHPREFYRVLRTIDEQFDHTSVWHSPGGADYFIIATRRPRPALENLARLLLEEQVRNDLEQIAIRRPADILGLHLLTTADLRDIDLGSGIGRFAALSANTDDFNRLRYGAARALWEPNRGAGYLALGAHRTLPYAWTGPLRRESSAQAELIAAIEDMQDYQHLSLTYDVTHDANFQRAFLAGLATLGVDAYRTPEFVREFEENAVEAPDRTAAMREIGRRMLAQARDDLARVPQVTDREQAIRISRDARVNAQMAVALLPDDHAALQALAEAQLRMGRRAEAKATVEKLLARGGEVSDWLRRLVEQ